MKEEIPIAVIGGTGSDILLENPKEIKVYTPFGSPSATITIGEFQGKKIGFIPRHGVGHTIPPHLLNNRANIWALKELGVKVIISPSAVGALKVQHDKGKFILVDQYIDRTKKRIDTFYEGGQLAHVGQADPYCSYLNDLLFETGSEMGLKIQKGGIYVCIEGPRFSTRSESKIFRSWGGDVIGMTTYPEVVLAAEKEICYCCIAMVTDLDVWAAKCPNCGIVEHGEKCDKCGGAIQKLVVNVPEVLETMDKNSKHLKQLLEQTIPKIDINRDCYCHHYLEGALL